MLAPCQAFYEEHYRRWIDDPVPAAGRPDAPRAAGVKRVRPKLVALLQELENMLARDRLDGRPAYDFGWMWKELEWTGRSEPRGQPRASVTPSVTVRWQSPGPGWRRRAAR